MSVQPLHVLLIAGSPEKVSRIRAMLAVLEQSLHTLGISTTLWDLATAPLPFFEPCYYNSANSHPSPEVRSFVQEAEQAQAFVWGSPVYHNSFSGVLKNALDMLSERQLRNKPVALVSSGSNDRTGSQPCDQLRVIVRSFHAIAIPHQIVALPTDFARNAGYYTLEDQGLRERAILLASELVTYARALYGLQSVRQASAS